MENAFLLLSAALTCLALADFLASWFCKHHLLDTPQERSNHQTPTPVCGGIAIFFTAMISIFVVQGANLIIDTNFQLTPLLQPHWILYVSALILMLISAYDDFFDAPIILRLVLQIAIIVFCLPTIMDHRLLFNAIIPTELELLIWIGLWLAFINFFNFMDGADGLSAIAIITIITAILILHYMEYFDPLIPVPILWLLLVLTIGFAGLNCPKAILFLGDAGSIVFGFILAASLIDATLSGYGAFAIIASLYYLIDPFMTLLKRMIKGERFWRSHSTHSYQQALARGWSHQQLAFCVILLNSSLILLALLSLMAPIAAFILASVIVLATMYYMQKGKV